MQKSEGETVMKNIFQTKLQIKGVGSSKEQAINTALGNIQKKVMDDYKGMIIRIEPMDVQVIEAKESSYTERFLFFFFPRKRSKYKVVLEIEVKVFLLEVDKIQFEKIDEPNNIRNMILGHQANK